MIWCNECHRETPCRHVGNINQAAPLEYHVEYIPNTEGTAMSPAKVCFICWELAGPHGHPMFSDSLQVKLTGISNIDRLRKCLIRHVANSVEEFLTTQKDEVAVSSPNGPARGPDNS